MGVLIYRNEDAKLYADTYEEAQRIIRISDEVRMSLEKVNDVDNRVALVNEANIDKLQGVAATKSMESLTPNYSKLTTAKLAKELGLKTQELNDRLIGVGYLEEKEGELVLTDLGRAAGGTSKRGKFGEFWLWDSGMVI